MNCEICGRDTTEDLQEVDIEGAKLNVCRNCQDLGTSVEQEDEKNKNTTKYTTSTSNEQEFKEQNSNKQYENQLASFDEVSNLAQDFGDKIRDERARQDKSREDFAHDLGIKQSHLRNIENEDTTPSIDLQGQIESQLDIDLSLDEELRD